MSAAPDIRPHSLDSAMEAAIQRMEEDEAIIRGLKKQNERLKAELLNAQLEASLEIAKYKFAAAQVGEAHRRIEALEKSVAALDEAQNRTGNIVQGLPTRDALEAIERALNTAIEKIGQVGRDFYAHSANH